MARYVVDVDFIAPNGLIVRPPGPFSALIVSLSGFFVVSESKSFKSRFLANVLLNYVA